MDENPIATNVEPEAPNGAWGMAQAVTRRLQHRVASAVGVDERGRAGTVLAMLENNWRRAPGYWIQLFLSMGIATLGLVLGSTAVVIGAMLVSPLMGPILELGMGFAVGSSFLVIRASLRVGLSVAVVVIGAALLTLALPFHEITGEIASRTAPTALDLFVAMFCALTAAYTTVRPASDTTSAAAGTAIGIALVPPLCTCGFGLGTGSLAVAGGATLLFTANISGILVLSVLSFLLLGFNQVDAARLETRTGGGKNTRLDRVAARGEARLQAAFGSKYGLAMRLIIPAIFLAAVYVPLRRALNEVTWEVRARTSIRGILDDASPRPVQSTLAVEHHTVDLTLLVIGSVAAEATLQRVLESRITAATGVVPLVTVTAVPDARTLSVVVHDRVSPVGPERINELRQSIHNALVAAWPKQVAGPLAGWDLTIPSARAPIVVVRHLGPPLGPAGASMLGGLLAARSGAGSIVVDDPLAPGVIAATLGHEQRWLDSTRLLIAWVGRTQGISACVTGPVAPTRRVSTAQRAIAAAIRGIGAPVGRVALRDSARWTSQAVAGVCPGGMALQVKP